MTAGTLDGADWPTFGWSDDVRPAMAAVRAGGRSAVLATLFKVEGSAPRGPGAQMLFDGSRASGYFSGDCIEGDVALHACEVLASGIPQTLHYGAGSPWIDIRLRCGGALHVMLERLAPDCPAVGALLTCAEQRVCCLWQSNGAVRQVTRGEGSLLAMEEQPFRLTRRYDPRRRMVISGGDPGALAIASLAAQAGLETILVRPGGPESAPPFALSRYLRITPEAALTEVGVDRWTAYLGATHEDHHDLVACLHALRDGAGYVGMIGAKSRAEGRMAQLRVMGASEAELARLHLSPGIAGLGKAPWEVATGILAEVMQAMNPARERA